MVDKEVIESSGLLVRVLRDLIPEKMDQALRANRYEALEMATLKRILRPGDRVLDLGAGLGLLAATAARTEGIASVTAVEANADLCAVADETLRLNGITTVSLRNALVTATPAPAQTYYLRPEFWTSSTEPDSRPYTRAVALPCVTLAELIAELRPTVIISRLRGAELTLFDGADLSGVRAMLVEFRPRIFGEKRLAKVMGTLAAKGLTPSPRNKDGAVVQLLERAEAAPLALPFPARSFRDWPIKDPRIFIATCMKDEGPFILEWVAWHRAMGVTDITVFTNDCSDGTDLILDRLQDLGLAQHLPNPAFTFESTAFQPVALNYAHQLKSMREADFFISMDVDEFINVTVGDHSLPALFAATGPFDCLSMSEVNHGCNGNQHYERGWLTELFPGHQSTSPGKFRARRGVKTITRLSERVEKLRNHRPDMRSDLGPILWLNGSGHVTQHFMADRSENGHDSRGTFGLVRLEHFPLRSLDSYLAKMYRGDVVVMGKQVSRTYWRMRNRQDEFSMACEVQLKRAKAWFKKHLEKDKPLMALHDAACDAHAARIESLVRDPVFKERRDWALREAWTDAPDVEAAE